MRVRVRVRVRVLQRPSWSDGLGFLDGLRLHGGFNVRVYNLMDDTGAFVDATPSSPGRVQGLSMNCLAEFAMDVEKVGSTFFVCARVQGVWRKGHVADIDVWIWWCMHYYWHLPCRDITLTPC